MSSGASKMMISTMPLKEKEKKKKEETKRRSRLFIYANDGVNES